MTVLIDQVATRCAGCRRTLPYQPTRAFNCGTAPVERRHGPGRPARRLHDLPEGLPGPACCHLSRLRGYSTKRTETAGAGRSPDTAGGALSLIRQRTYMVNTQPRDAGKTREGRSFRYHDRRPGDDKSALR